MPTRTSYRAHRQAGFSLIEVIIAMTLLSIVVTSAAFAVVSSDSAQLRVEAVSDSHAVAEQSVERLRTDLSARAECDAAGWIAAARAHKLSGSAAAADFATCLKEYDDIKDPKGRRYLVDVRVTPVDLPADGTGSGDTDGDLRDRYDVVTTVELAADSKAGRETVQPLEVAGSVDWKGGSTDPAMISVIACGVDRTDRSVVAGGCGDGSTPSRMPLSVVVTLRKVNEETGALGTAFTVTAGSAAATIEPGAYEVQAPATFSADGSTFTLLKVDPQRLSIAGSQDYSIYATYVRGASSVRVCTQIGNWTPPYDDGYEVASTNMHYRRVGSAAYRSERLPIRADRSWDCSTVLRDTVDINSGLFRGLYDVEVEQARSAIATTIWGLRVQAARWNCTGPAWNQALDGTAVYAPRPFEDTLDRKNVDENPAPSWYGRFAVNTGGDHTLCIRFYDRQYTRERCTQNADGSWPADCFKTGTECVQYCPSGERVCFQNCNRDKSATLSMHWVAQAAKPFGGPSDPTVGCRPSAQGGYEWFGWSPPVILEGVVGQQATQAQFSGYEWVGGGETYYTKFSGHYGSGPVFYCEHLSFAASWKYLCKQGSMEPASTKAGFVECRYHYGDCIQAELSGFPGVFVRGYMRDISVNYEKPIIPSINALRGLAYLNGMDRPELINGWSPGTWWDSLDLKIAKVGESWACDWDDSTGTGYRWEDPVIHDVYMRIVNRPDLFDPKDRSGLGNLTSNRAGV